MKICKRCEYDLSGICRFPDPQKGGARPMMVTAAMPNPHDDGRGCLQFREAGEDDPRAG